MTKEQIKKLGQAISGELRRKKTAAANTEVIADSVAYRMAVEQSDTAVLDELAAKYLRGGQQPTPTRGGGKSVPSPNSDDNEALSKRVKRLESRADGHDRRHEKAEENLKALNGAVGITRKKGTWVPVPDGQFDRNVKVQEHLGYTRAENGSVSFKRPAHGASGPMPHYWILVVTFIVALVLLWLFFASGGGAVYALVAMPVAVAIGSAAFFTDLSVRARRAAKPSPTSDPSR